MAGHSCAAHWSLRAHALLSSLMQHLKTCICKPHLTSQHDGHANSVALQLRAKAEQVAVRCAGYDSLQVDLAEAQTQLAAHCAHVQVHASLISLFIRTSDVIPVGVSGCGVFAIGGWDVSCICATS